MAGRLPRLWRRRTPNIYALGLVLSEMASGKRALQGKRPALDALPERLAHVIERCLEHNPDDRWQTARDVRAELQWAARPASGAESPSPSKSPPLKAAAVAALLIALVALGFVHFRERPPEVRVVRSTILPPEKPTFSFPTSRGPVALSPDGRRMAFAATAEDGKSQLWVRLLEAETAQPLPGTEGGAFPFWSPDSRFVAFVMDGKLKKIDTQGGGPVTLADAGTGQHGSWSPNGTIVFSKDAGTLWKISSTGGNALRATAPDDRGETNHWAPWFLPDGEHFLFQSRGNLLVGSLSSTASKIVGEATSNVMYAEGRLLYLKGTSLMAQPFDVKALRTTGEAVPLVQDVEGFTSPGISGIFSVLSPDRKSLAASALDASGNQNLWIYNLGNGVATRFTNDRFAEVGAVWSADGTTIAFSSQRTGHTGVYRKPANGSGPEELLYADDTAKTPTSWSPDGKFLLYYTSTDGPTLADVWLLPLTPQPPGAPLKAVPFIQTPGNERFPQVSPDGRWVAYDQDTLQGRQIFVVASFQAGGKAPNLDQSWLQAPVAAG
jgi:Tol biopolymer transport system component